MITAFMPTQLQWTAANFGGATKRAFAAAVVSGSFSIGNIIGPQTFQARDAPNYRPAKVAVMGTQAGCAAVTITLYFYYRWQNKRRDVKCGMVKEDESAFMSPEAWASLTDTENMQFRYCY
jgi:H+/gluconate symporter-like permease